VVGIDDIIEAAGGRIWEPAHEGSVGACGKLGMAV
jgi:hypothetical protein